MNLEYILYGTAFAEGSWTLFKIYLTSSPNFEFPPESDKKANKIMNRFIMLPGPVDVMYLTYARYLTKKYDKNKPAP